MKFARRFYDGTITWIAHWYKLLEPILMVTLTISIGLLTYQIPESFLQQYPIVYTHASIFVENSIWIIIGTLFIWIILYIGFAIASPRIHELNTQLNEAETKNNDITKYLKEFFDGLMLNIGNKMEFLRDHDNSDRATLYIHDGENGFIPFARYSDNPELKKIIRQQHRDDVGLLSKGWQSKWAFADGVSNDRKSQIEFHASHRMSRADARKLRMQSRTYAVYRIDDHAGNGRAVVVIESTDPHRFDEDTIKSQLENESQYLLEAVRTFQEYIPVPSEARKRGF